MKTEGYRRLRKEKRPFVLVRAPLSPRRRTTALQPVSYTHLADEKPVRPGQAASCKSSAGLIQRMPGRGGMAGAVRHGVPGIRIYQSEYPIYSFFRFIFCFSKCFNKQFVEMCIRDRNSTIEIKRIHREAGVPEYQELLLHLDTESQNHVIAQLYKKIVRFNDFNGCLLYTSRCV